MTARAVHAVAAGPFDEDRQRPYRHPDAARPDGCGPLPRRRDDHAGVVRHVGRRGSEAGYAGARGLSRADFGGDHGAGLRRPFARHRRRRAVLRPITAVWFLVMAAGGLSRMYDDYGILDAFNPIMPSGSWWMRAIPASSCTAPCSCGDRCGSALCGSWSFGRQPIQWTWFVLVFPSLALNYLDQGALVLAHPATCPRSVVSDVSGMGAAAGRPAGERRDDHRQPGGYHRRLLLVRQAVHLGFLPRLEITFTSETNTGQIDVPSVNTVLFVGVLVLVLSSGTSEALATAYGISVTGAMVVTSIMAFDTLPPLELVASRRGDRACAAGRARNDLPWRQPFEDPRRRLYPDHDRHRLYRRHVDLASRLGAPDGKDAPHRYSARIVRQLDRAQERSFAGTGSGHRDLSDQRSGIRAGRIAARSDAQPCPSRQATSS